MAFEYNLNMQVWEDEDNTFVYHVIQNHEDGKDEILVYGEADTKRDALREAAEAVLEELSDE